MPDIKLTESDFPAAEAGKFKINNADDLSGDYLLGRQVAQEYDAPTVQLYLNEQIKQEDIERQAAESEGREAAGVDVSLERNEREFAETMVESLQSRRGEAFKSLPKEVEKEESEKIAAEFESGVEEPNFDPVMAGAAGVGGVGMIAFNQTRALMPSLTRAMTAGVVNAVGDVPIGVGMDVLDIKAPGLALPFGIVAGLLQGATVETAIERGIVKAAAKAGRSLSKVDIADMVQQAKFQLSNETGAVGADIGKRRYTVATDSKIDESVYKSVGVDPIREVKNEFGYLPHQAVFESEADAARLMEKLPGDKTMYSETRDIGESLESVFAGSSRFVIDELNSEIAKTPLSVATDLLKSQRGAIDVKGRGPGPKALEDVKNLRSAIKKIGGINFLHFKGELKEMPHVAVNRLSKKTGMPLDTAENMLKDAGWLDENESLLDVLRNPESLKRGRLTRDIGEKAPEELTDTDKALRKDMNWEQEGPPEGEYFTVNAESLEIGKKLTLIEGKTLRGWDVYTVKDKDPFGITLEDGKIINMAPGDVVHILQEGDIAKVSKEVPGAKPRRKNLIKRSQYWEFMQSNYKEWASTGVPELKGIRKKTESFLENTEPDTTGPYAGNIRLWGGADLQPKFVGQIETPEDINRVIAGTHETFASETEAARRGVRSWDETKEAAKQYNLEDLMGRKLGQAYAAEEIENARTLLVSSSDTLKAMSDKVRTGQANDLEKMEFMKAFNLNYAIQMQLSGAAAEAGRALNIFRKVAQSDALRVGQIKDFLATTADASINPEKLAQAISEMELPGQVNKLVKQARRASSWDMFVEAWINGLLSGPVTHAVNTTSNALVALYAVPERLFAAGISQTVGSGVIRKGEASAQAFGLIEGFKDGLKAGWKSLRSGESADITTKIEQQQYRAISAQNVRQLPLVSKISPNALEEGGVAARAVDILGEAIRVPGRFLTAEDDFFKSIGYRMELNAQAFRKAAGEGLEGDALALRIQEIKADPEKLAPEIHLAAIDAARYQTFTNELGPAGKGVQAAANNSPLKLIIPFIRTPANILKFAASRSPLAVAMPSVWQDIFPKVRTPDALARRELALARVSLGSMAMATIASFAASGHVTGGGPTDTGLRSHKYNQGWQPYSIKIGDSYYAYGRLEPLGMMMGLAADFVEIGGELSELEGEEIATTIVAAFSKNVMSKTWLRGLSEAVSALDDPDRYGPRYVRRFTGTVIPTGVAQVERVISPEMSEVRSMMDSIKSRIPGYSKDIPDRRNLWGEKILLSPGLGPDIMSPIFTSKKKSSPIDKELEELKAPVRMPSRTQSFEGVRIALTPQQYDDFVVTMNKSKIVGPDNRERNLKDTLNYLVTKNSDYKSLRGNDLKEQFIRDYIRQAQVQTRNEMAETDADIKFFIEESQRIEQAANF